MNIAAKDGRLLGAAPSEYPPPEGRPDLAAVRQIGHELLVTLFGVYPKKLRPQAQHYKVHFESIKALDEKQFVRLRAA